MTDDEAWAKIMAEVDAQDKAPPLSTGYETTTATTPAEKRKEEQQQFVEEMRSDLATSRGAAATRGAVRGATLGILPYAKAEGEQLGEDVYRLVHGQALTAGRDVEREVLQREMEKDREAARDYPATYAGAEMVGTVAPSLLIPGSRAAGFAGLGVPLAERQGLRATVARGLANPEANIMAQNAVSGATATGSLEQKELATGAAGGVLAGKVLGAVAEKTIGKVIKEAPGREANNLIRDILRNEKTDVGVTATARKRFYEKGSAALDEVRADPHLRSAIRNGDAATAARLAKGKLEIISEPRDGLYNELDSVVMLTIGQIDSAIRKAERTATGATRDALRALRERLNTDWVERWQHTGMLVQHAPQEAERGLVGLAVKGRGVREWLTDAQNQADLVIGGLEEGPRKKVKGALEDVAHDVWHEHLARAEKRNLDVVRAIRQYDKRASGLLAIESVMKQRAQKDYEGRLGLGKRAEAFADSLIGTGAIVGAVAGRPVESLGILAARHASKKMPIVGRALSDLVVAPIQRAAMAGRPWADVAVTAAEHGIPQAIARSAYDSGVKMRQNAQNAAVGGPNYSVSTAIR